MPKYCPVCLGEFKDSVIMCPKDQTSLVTDKPAAIEKLVDIYAASDEIEAERIIVFLREEGLLARQYRSGISQLPSVSDDRHIVSVLKDNRSQARGLIEQARSDGVISNNGTFL